MIAIAITTKFRSLGLRRGERQQLIWGDQSGLLSYIAALRRRPMDHRLNNPSNNIIASKFALAGGAGRP